MAAVHDEECYIHDQCEGGPGEGTYSILRDDLYFMSCISLILFICIIFFCIVSIDLASYFAQIDEWGSMGEGVQGDHARRSP
jgi:hypothetical protein